MFWSYDQWNQCPVLVYVRSSDNVCAMKPKVFCKCVLFKRTMMKLCVWSLLSTTYISDDYFGEHVQEMITPRSLKLFKTIQKYVLIRFWPQIFKNLQVIYLNMLVVSVLALNVLDITSWASFPPIMNRLFNLPFRQPKWKGLFYGKTLTRILLLKLNSMATVILKCKIKKNHLGKIFW